MNVRIASDADKEAWNHLVESSPIGSFFQMWSWGDIQKKAGLTILRYCIESEGNLVGVAQVYVRPIAFGRSWLYIPRGPVVREITQFAHALTALQQELEKQSDELGAIFVRIDPVLQNSSLMNNTAWKKAEREVQPQHTFVLDLRKTEEELLSNMHSKTRYNIRLAQKKGVSVRFSSDVHDVDTFLQLATEVTERSGFRFHPDDYYRSIIEVLSKPDAGVSAELAIAEHEGEALAAHLMVYTGNRATYAHGASSLKKRSLMAPVLLYWETIKRAREKGYATYDLFGVAPPNADASHSWSGITRVKKGFGGTYESYIGAYDFVLDSTKYVLFNTARRIRRLLPS